MCRSHIPDFWTLGSARGDEDSSGLENDWITENVYFRLKQLSVLSDTSCKSSF